MTAAGVFAFIVSVAKAVPTLDSWLQQFLVWYASNQLDSMKAENFAAVKKAITDKDQRDLEKAIGNPNAGEPSNIGGAVIRDSLPGVPNPPTS